LLGKHGMCITTVCMTDDFWSILAQLTCYHNEQFWQRSGMAQKEQGCVDNIIIQSIKQPVSISKHAKN
jgi:hypothetical protein